MKYTFVSISSQVDKFLQDKESGTVEFKSALGGFPKSFWETYSAFGNTQGGVIILGVKEHDGIFEPNNLSDEAIDKLQKDFWNGVRNKNTVNICLLQQKDVEVGIIGRCKVLVFHIPAAKREQRPVHCTLDAFNGTYRRNYEGDYLCSPMEVRRMFADADISRPADGRILKNFSWDDIDRPSLNQYRLLFSVARPSHPWLSLPDEELMRKLGGYRKDRETGEEGFTVAGLLMFGKFDSIRDENCVPRFFPDYKEIPVNTMEQRWIDRIYPDGSWEANLFQFYRRVLPKLQEVVPTPFKLENSQRIDETLAHESIREALANLCIHADYSEESSLLVYRFPNRLLFSNPGTMLVTPMQFYSGGESVCRNTHLQTMFMMLGSADKAGSGGDKILKGWDSIGLIHPYISERSQPNKVELLMPLESLMDKRITQELQKKFGEACKSLNNDELMVLALALTENKINHERLRYALPLHPADITRILQRLTKLEMLTSDGHGRGTIYRLKDSYSKQTLQGSGQTLQGSGQTLQGSGQTLQAETTGPRHISRNIMYEKIVSFCSDWRSAEEIAVFVQRSKRYLTNEILPEMSALLDLKYPQVKRHPDQQYRRKSIEDKKEQ